MERGHTATVGGPVGRRVRAQFLQHSPKATDPGVRDRTLPQWTPLIDTSFRIQDVEKAGPDTGYIPLNRLGDVWISSPVEGNAHAALYEALVRWLD